MNYPEVLKRIAYALDRAGIAYMLTGSFASVFYGLPRSTQDIDLVIEATPAQLRSFLENLPRDEYYVDAEAACEAHSRESLFNVIDARTSWKIDMIVRKSRPFSRQEFNRRRRVDVGGISLFIASPEDVVLAKLEWGKLGESRRQIEDAAGILKLQFDSLDRSYLEKWVRDLGLAEQWRDALRLSTS